MEAPDVRRATEAAEATAASLGLQARDAVVLHNSNRIVRAPDAVRPVARVAPSAHHVGPSSK